MSIGKRMKEGLDLTSGDPIYWCNADNPNMTKVLSRHEPHKDGEGMAVENIPQGYRPELGGKEGWNQRYREMISPAGNLVRVVLTSGASNINIRGSEAMHRYNKKIKKGFIPADECPIATYRMPQFLRKEDDEPCEEWIDADGSPRILQEHKKGPCKHVKRIMSHRKVRQANNQAEMAKKMRTEIAAMNELLTAREKREMAAAMEAHDRAEETRLREAERKGRK